MIDRFKLVSSNEQALIEQLKIMLSLNSAVEVIARPWKDKRSISQNALYWKWLGEVSEQAVINDQVHKPDIWHEYFKRYFCPIKIIAMPAGEDLNVRSTKKLDSGEMHYYLNQIEQWAMGHMYVLTTPDNCEYQKLKNQQIR